MVSFLGGEGGRLPVFMLIGWRATNNHVLYSWAEYSGTKCGRVKCALLA